MEKFEINATKRSVIGKKVRALRREGKLPGIVYSHKAEPVSIAMDLRESTKILVKASSSSIIYLNLDGTQLATIVREKQRDYLKNRFLHVDFQEVSLTEKIRADVHIVLTGLAPAVKDFNGVVVEGLTSIEVEALPSNLPERFTVDISGLKEIGNSIQVKDLVIPEGVDVHSSLDEMIVLVTSPAAEEVEEVAAVETEVEPEVIEKGKKEEEEETEEK